MIRERETVRGVYLFSKRMHEHLCECRVVGLDLFNEHTELRRHLLIEIRSCLIVFYPLLCDVAHAQLYDRRLLVISRALKRRRRGEEKRKE